MFGFGLPAASSVSAESSVMRSETACFMMDGCGGLLVLSDGNSRLRSGMSRRLIFLPRVMLGTGTIIFNFPLTGVVNHADPRVSFKPLFYLDHFKTLQRKNDPKYILQRQRRRCRSA